MISIVITKRKIKQIFARFPSWSQEDIASLTFELTERRKSLVNTINNHNANQVRDRGQLEFQVHLLDEGLKGLLIGKYKSSPQYELLETLFDSYLKSDGRKVNTGRR